MAGTVDTLLDDRGTALAGFWRALRLLKALQVERPPRPEDAPAPLPGRRPRPMSAPAARLCPHPFALVLCEAAPENNRTRRPHKSWRNRARAACGPA